jgi:starch synthase
MPLRICFIASEVAPLAKTGGLADVSGALAKYLHLAGHDIRLFMPLYGQIDRSKLEIWPVDYLQDVPLRLGSHALRFSVHTARLPGAQTMVYLIDCPRLYERETIYTNAPDEHLRFIALTHAALACCQRMGFSPEIVHCNDWHTAFAPLLLKSVFAWDRLFQQSRSLLTLHNLGYQGVFSAGHIDEIGLDGAQHLLDYTETSQGRVNPLKEGLRHADALSTVSPTYAREIQTPEYGWGLDGVLRERAADITGILNGVDYEEWDPRHDRFLPQHFSAENLRPKARLKTLLMQRTGLEPVAKRPLLGLVSRMTLQKGFDLLFDTLPAVLAARDLALVALGSGDTRYEAFFTELQHRFPGRVAFHRGYSDELAHWIEAGADMFLMPSLYEPCGLNQMYSLRYGTVPIVRRTGGLADSVAQFDPSTGEGTGIVFNDFDAGGVRWALETALDAYAQPAWWRRMVHNGMAQDFSWRRQVGDYEALYHRMLGGH